ncbi:MAG: hypothetical protein WAM05_15265, partial [Candidatus Binataceae bacterium]
DSTSCKTVPVEGNRSQFRAILAASFRRHALATGEISRDARSASLCARHGAGNRFALEMTLNPRALVLFRARAGSEYRVVLAASSSEAREESRPRHSHTLSMHRAKLSPAVAADGPSAIGGSRRWLRRTVQKSTTEKAAETNPFGQKRQRFRGVYFLSH